MKEIKISRDGRPYRIAIGNESVELTWVEMRQLLTDIARAIAEYDKESIDQDEDNIPYDEAEQTERNEALAFAEANGIRLVEVMLNLGQSEDNKIQIEGLFRMLLESLIAISFRQGEGYVWERIKKGGEE